MPKYIKLFENFISEATPYPFDPVKSVLTGAKVYNDTMYYAIFKLGRIYIASKDSESVKSAAGNVSVTLDANNPTLQKQLISLGGKLDGAANGKIPEPSGGVYTHLAKIHFNLTDSATGEPILKKIVDLLSGVVASSSGTSGTAGTAGTAGNLADQIFGKDLAAAFRDSISKQTGNKPYSADSSIKASIQPKIDAADKDLRSSNPEYLKVATDAANRAKELKLDPVTGKDKAGKEDATYLQLKKKQGDMLAAAVKL